MAHCLKNLIQVARGVINSNCTFVHLMARAGAFFGQLDANSGKQSKPAANIFETLVAAFVFDKGYGALCDWVGKAFGPIFDATQKAYDDLCVL